MFVTIRLRNGHETRVTYNRLIQLNALSDEQINKEGFDLDSVRDEYKKRAQKWKAFETKHIQSTEELGSD